MLLIFKALDEHWLQVIVAAEWFVHLQKEENHVHDCSSGPVQGGHSASRSVKAQWHGIFWLPGLIFFLSLAATLLLEVTDSSGLLVELLTLQFPNPFHS